ncbi:MAG: hypothetical protein LBK47_06710 [Prevotellaceae bacterium]|jgi:hypothetical protein|nr:hypothetical protein [Prevotellaceae bacterium]
MAYLFDDTGVCMNPTTVFTFSGKYLSVRITSADTPGGVVFGYFFRSVRTYKIVACRQDNNAVPADDKKGELRKIIDCGVVFFESKKYEDRALYEKDITSLREKRAIFFQLTLF